MLLREVKDSSLGTFKGHGCGTWGYGSVVIMVGLGVSEVLSNLNDSVLP